MVVIGKVPIGLVGFRNINRIDNVNEIGIIVYSNLDDHLPSKLLKGIIMQIREVGFQTYVDFAEKVNVKKGGYLFSESLIHNYRLDLNQKTIGNSFDFIKNPLLCEWAYILNLAEETMEIYRGFNKNPKEAEDYARFNVGNNDGYYGSRLIFKLSIDEIKKMHQSEIELFCYFLEEFCDIMSEKFYINITTEKLLDEAIFKFEKIQNLISSQTVFNGLILKIYNSFKNFKMRDLKVNFQLDQIKKILSLKEFRRYDFMAQIKLFKLLFISVLFEVLFKNTDEILNEFNNTLKILESVEKMFENLKPKRKPFTLKILKF